MQESMSGPCNLPLEYLRNITNNFSDERLLGEGGFGTVYKGVLPNGESIAVKKLNSSMPGVKDRQFENESYHLMRLKHTNIVLLVGWCCETENIYVEYNGKYVCAEKSERLLCLEYMPKGNLSGYLSDESCGLTWETRYKIIKGICYGLRYLHEEWQPNAPTVHMDLKPANTLLDNNMVPKIADFGLSRLFSEEKTWTCTISRDGTLGYMAPEYINRGLISTKSDIFSLGVIIIEIVTGQRDYPDESGNGISSQEFTELVLKNWRDRLQQSLRHTSLEIDYQQIRRCVEIGLDCVKIDRWKRPTISQVIKVLHGTESVNLSRRKEVMSLKNEVCQQEHWASTSGAGDGGIKGTRSPPPLKPPPTMALPVVCGAGSTWDILRSFAPDGQEHAPASRPARVLGHQDAVDKDEEDAVDMDEEEAAVSEDFSFAKSSEYWTANSSLSSTNGGETSSRTTEFTFSISPNLRFRRRIRSWIRGALLGSGSFGTVYEGISDEGVFFAVKEVDLFDQGSHVKQCIFQLEKEIALLSQFEHENIVQYYGTDKEDSKLYVFLELVTQGSLASLYQKYRLGETQVSAYTRQILNGLTYLHERNIVHRDIKCANILVHGNGSVKLADFGVAKELTKFSVTKSCIGNVYWMAPEVVNPKKTYGSAADIWSLGCTVLEMLTRQIPYPDLEWTQALHRIGKGEAPSIPSALSKDARDFISHCVKPYPEDRPSASELLEHPFISRSVRSVRSMRTSSRSNSLKCGIN